MTMPSNHYATVAKCVQQNSDLLEETGGASQSERRAVLNLGTALLALSDALQDEFIQISNRLVYIEEQLDRTRKKGTDLLRGSRSSRSRG